MNILRQICGFDSVAPSILPPSVQFGYQYRRNLPSGWREGAGSHVTPSHKRAENGTNQVRNRHPGELISVVSAFALAGAAAYFFWGAPGWSPQSEWPKYALAWIVIGYLAIQLITLLETVLSVRLTGMIDAVTSIVPFVIGLVVLVNSVQGVLKLSVFQENALALLLSLSLLDFIVTLWIRFAVNRRTLGIDTGAGG
jgi:hypothetical protein